MIDGFVAHLSGLPQEQIANRTLEFQQQFNLELTLHANNELALPQSLLADLTLPGGLILEDEQGFYLLRALHPASDNHLELRLIKPKQGNNRFDLILTLSFYFGVCLLMWVWLSPLTKRLSLLNEASQQFANGDLMARIKISKFTYIHDVEAAFNRMAAQIQKLIEENKLLASSMSHDIRTPVACLRFGLDAALDTEDLVKKDHYLQRMETDLDHMECMITSYLEFATLEKNSYQITLSHTQLKPYLASILSQLSPKLSQKGLIGTLECEDLSINADLHWLARAITNLLSNATDFAEHKILLKAEATHNTINLTVEDDGQGIASENWQHVFDPFFKEQSHRNRSDKSYGLGLAIAAKVADWHFASIKVDQSPTLGGARFTLSLPLKCPLIQN